MNNSRESALLLQTLSDGLNRQFKGSSKRNQLSAARLSIIQYLIKRGPQTLKSIATYRKVSAPTMSRLMTALVTEGLVLRANSKHDRRSKIFIATRKGKKLASGESEQEIELLKTAIEKLTDQEQVNLKGSVLLVQKVINLIN